MRGNATIDGGLELESTHTAADGTTKLLFRLTVRLSSLSDVSADQTRSSVKA